MSGPNTGLSSSLRTMLDNDNGQIFVSILLGLGLGALFRKACHGDQCIVIKSPPDEETKRYYYKIDDNCYKYVPIATECDKRP